VHLLLPEVQLLLPGIGCRVAVGTGGAVGKEYAVLVVKGVLCACICLGEKQDELGAVSWGKWWRWRNMGRFRHVRNWRSGKKR
jgi:hypothetical protein